MERTLTFIKPDFEEKAIEIYDYLDSQVKETKTLYLATNPNLIYIPEKTMREHYTHILHFPFAEKKIKEFSKKGVILRIYEGENIAQVIVDITGPTDPSKGEPYQLRRHFSNDKLEVALAENRPVKNVIHRSTPEDAEKEIQRFNNFINWATLCLK